MVWTRFLKEPIVHFLFLGGSIFLINSIVNPNQDRPESTEIIVDDDDIDRLVTHYQQVWNEAPQPSTVRKLIDQYVHSEVMYREALALNLDHNDEIIKRRLKQKFEFLIKDMVTTNQVPEQELKAYYEDHKSDFMTENIYSFYQFYFSPDKRHNALEDAIEYLQRQQSQANTVVSDLPAVDPSHLHQFYKHVPKHQIRQEFGLAFADAFQDVTSESWHGPIASGFGIHIIYIDSISTSTTADFNLIKDQVQDAYEKELIEQYDKNIYESVLENYSIDIKLDKWANILD